MNRPCTCDLPTCHPCWLFANDPRYQKLWSTPTPMKGLGDVFAAVTQTFGIEPCGGCEERRKLLNDLFPFSPK